MVYDIFNFLTGYVYVKIEGQRLERLLNSSVSFWNIRRSGYFCIYANVSLFAYNKLKKQGEYNITLIKEKGAFSLFKRLWRKRILFFGLVLCAAGLVVMSNTVVSVEVDGQYTMPKDEIIQYVREFGIAPFTFKQKIDLDGLCAFLKEKNKVAWVSAGYDGVVLNIELIEQVNEYDGSPCNIVADRQAQIKSIDVYDGVKNKQPGDVVGFGELLVAGIKQQPDGTKLIKARGKIVGVTWEEGSYSLEVNGLKINNTGNGVTEKYIDFWGNKGFINRTENTFEHFVVTTDRKQIGILPVYYVTRTFNEVSLGGDGEDINEVTAKVGEMAFADGAARIPHKAKILSVNTKYEVSDGVITAKALIEYEIEIGVDAPLK